MRIITFKRFQKFGKINISVIFFRKPQIKNGPIHDENGSTATDLLRHCGRLLRDEGKK